MTALTALILAGGQSSRMGQDKALMWVRGVPLLQRVYNVARQCTSEVAVITPWPTRYQALLPPSTQFLTEPRSTTLNAPGPLVAFAEGLAQIKAEWVLLLACDLPRLRAEVLQSWMQELDQVPETTIALLPRHPKGWEPLCGFYRHCCLAGLQTFINQGGRSFQEWLAEQSVQALPVIDPAMLVNCNTPSDIQQEHP